MVVTQSILSFLLSIIISLGGSVTVDNVGQDFSTIYNNQNPFVQNQIDQCALAVDPTGQLMTNLKSESIKLTTEMLYDIQGGRVSNQVIQESIGIDAWKDFVNSNQNNVAGFGKTISTTDGYKLRFYVDRHPSYDPDTGRFSEYVVWYDVTDSDGNVVKRAYLTENRIYGFKDEVDATTALGNSYIDKDGKFHFLSYDGRELEIVDCANLFPAGTSGQFTPAAFGDGTIGQITDATIAGTEIGQLPIAADGSIILPDGTKVYPNADGTYTIDNSVYSPTYNISNYDDSALLGLLQQLLTRIDELENKLEFEKEKEEDKELEEKQEEAIEDLEEAAAESEDVLSQYTYSSKRWANIFPFCIPWDFVRGVKLLSASPVAPRFTIPFEIPEFGSFKGYKTEIVLNFSDYEKYFKPVRWFTTTFFLISLGFITFKIVKGAA